MTLKLNYQFKDPALLEQALTHSSKHGIHFEALEFIGDRVLNLSLAIYLFNKCNYDESLMAKKIARLASADILKQIALKLQLDSALKCIPEQKNAILADACEALLGAIFLDCKDMNELNKFIHSHWQEFFHENYLDSKTQLQEISYKQLHTSPTYTLTQIGGKDHKPLFHAKVQMGNHHATGTGTSKKSAEKNAASALLNKLNT